MSTTVKPSNGKHPQGGTSSLPLGYRLTEVGVIPEDWQLRPVGEMGDVLAGKALAVRAPGKQRPYLRTKNVFDGRIDLDDVLSMPMTDAQFARYELHPGDLLLNEGQSLELVGRCAAYNGEYGAPCAIQNQLVRFRVRDGVSWAFAAHLFRHCQRSGVFAKIALQTTSVAHLGVSRFQRLVLAWPPEESEQRAIAEALSDVDGLIGAIEKLIAKKRAIKLAAMQQLLTGKTRLPGFSGRWSEKALADIATVSTEKNTEGRTLPVLTCSKHLGFVDSLAYFRNQVFSRDLSGYRIIRRDQIGYPANHIEEGSIGLQDLYDVAIVSPIYVVFSTDESVNSIFLHRLLKLERYRQEFASATSSSVDRRGSLRWPEFSAIRVCMPPREEQDAIAIALSDMDAEIEALERRCEKMKHIKQGMMQQLLTGRIRLVKPQPACAKADAKPNTTKGHNKQINEAVVIAVLAHHFGSEQYPLGRKRYTKLSYLLHRHSDNRVEDYQKKAAGPYNPKTRYGGPEKIALENSYLREYQGPKGHSGFVAGDNIAQAEGYFDKWYGADCLRWLEQFRRKKNDELELLATVDMAAEELRAAGKPVDATAVKEILRAHPEWLPKLDRAVFSDAGIAKAIETCRALFSNEVEH